MEMIWLVKLTGDMNPKKLVKVHRKAEKTPNPSYVIKFHIKSSLPKAQVVEATLTNYSNIFNGLSFWNLKIAYVYRLARYDEQFRN
jgi:hypothetical protein